MLSPEQIPAFQFSMLVETTGTFRAFELGADVLLPQGTTVVGRYVADWHTLPAGSLCIVVSESRGIEFKAVVNPLAEDALEIWQVMAYIPAMVLPNLVELEAQIRKSRIGGAHA